MYMYISEKESLVEYVYYKYLSPLGISENVGHLSTLKTKPNMATEEVVYLCWKANSIFLLLP